jgi:hypothetical protein
MLPLREHDVVCMLKAQHTCPLQPVAWQVMVQLRL